MKSRLSKVLDKMPKEKIELAKVELGLVDDARKIISNFGNAERILNDVEIASKEVVKEYANLKIKIEKVKNSAETVIGAETNIKKISDLIRKGDDVLRKISSQAKELGISVNSINEFDELFDFTESLSTKINESEKYIRDVKDINNQIK